MKVLQIIDSLPETSGGARFVANLVKMLNKKHIETDLLLIDGRETHFYRDIKNTGVNIISLDKETSSRYKPKYIRKIAKILTDYDVVHVHIFPTSYLVALASLFAHKCPPIVFTEHSSYNRRAPHFLLKYLEKWLYSRFEKVVCLSEQVHKFVVDNLNINTDKLTIIENAIDAEAVFKAEPYSKTELGYHSSDFLLLMSARLDRQKNHQVLFYALEKLPTEVKLLLAGDGVLEDEIKKEVADLGLNERVSFLGSRSDIFRLLKSVDVNILASNFEGLSLAALEAMASGKPFIASNVSGLDFVVNNEKLLFDNNPNDIVSIVLELKNNRSFYESSVEYCLQRAKEFDFNVMTEKYIEVYKGAIDGE
ncbi:MAG: glycosyltransferase [Dysgonamonadaceae bacterium]|nr:glycosyltransferase [Dysgonamonadaceae bacterium]